MSLEHTQRQSDQEQRLTQQLSLQRSQPPTQVPGYEIKQLIGSGAYGEVWVALNQNTGRKVAIKFYTHQGGLDWPLLAREVEKLVFLSADRYVVQLLDVGWDADPPYYIMEYVEHGSLEDLLRQQGTLTLADAVEIFREVAVGLMHAHGKGVLHCDLKPANILLDQDQKPRLADFGQSRLSTEQLPALGTLFYMAPEQADLEAVPDSGWDVYALGAILYCMLTGTPPYRSEMVVTEVESEAELEERLASYREIICTSPLPTEHRRANGMDRALVEIVDRCLATDPTDRFDTVQRVVDAIDARAQSRAFRPLLILGIVGPTLLLLVMSLFAWRGVHRAVGDSEIAVTSQAMERNEWIAKKVADAVSYEIDRYYRALEQVNERDEFRLALQLALADERLAELLGTLADPDLDKHQHDSLKAELINHPARNAVQQYLDKLLSDTELPPAASWFVTSREGTHIGIAFQSGFKDSPIGKNYAWRTYFHGGPDDLEPGARPERHITETHLSAGFVSSATFTLKIAVSTPISLEKNESGKDDEENFVGILAMTLNVGDFLKIEGSTPDNQAAVLVDARKGKNRGVILWHPVFAELLAKNEGVLPKHLNEHRIDLEQWKSNYIDTYVDPISAAVTEGALFRKDWIAAKAPVKLRGRGDGNEQPNGGTETGLIVVVQEDRSAMIEEIRGLGNRLAREILSAMGVVIVVIGSLWFLVGRSMRGTKKSLRQAGSRPPNDMSGHSSTADGSTEPEKCL